jgi:hypothetical protein
MTFRRLRAAVALAAVLAPALLATPPASASSCTIHASMRAPDHAPRVNRNWYITVTASPRIRTHAKYQFLFHGRVVSTQYVLYNRNYTFVGRFRDPLKFPKRALGIPLTLRVVLSNRCGTKNLDWNVKVRR